MSAHELSRFPRTRRFLEKLSPLSQRTQPPVRLSAVPFRTLCLIYFCRQSVLISLALQPRHDRRACVPRVPPRDIRSDRARGQFKNDISHFFFPPREEMRRPLCRLCSMEARNGLSLGTQTSTALDCDIEENLAPVKRSLENDHCGRSSTSILSPFNIAAMTRRDEYNVQVKLRTTFRSEQKESNIALGHSFLECSMVARSRGGEYYVRSVISSLRRQSFEVPPAARGQCICVTDCRRCS